MAVPAQHFWVVLTPKLVRLDEINQLAEVEVFSKWFWQDSKFIAKIKHPGSGMRLAGDVPADISAAFEKGERVFGCWIEGNTGGCPVNVRRIFLNQIGEHEMVSAWTRFETKRNNRVSVQLDFKVTLEYRAETLAHYPFDRLVIPLRLSMGYDKKQAWRLDATMGGRLFGRRLYN